MNATSAPEQTVQPSTEVGTPPAPMPPPPPEDARPLRERIRSRPVKRGDQVEVAEWDATVEVRSLSISDKADLFEDVSMDGDGEDIDLTLGQFTALFPKLVMLTTYDPDTGERLFDEDDLEWLETVDARVLEPVALVGLRVSGLGKNAVESGKGASSSTQAAPTSSPSPSG